MRAVKNHETLISAAMPSLWVTFSGWSSRCDFTKIGLPSDRGITATAAPIEAW